MKIRAMLFTVLLTLYAPPSIAVEMASVRSFVEPDRDIYSGQLIELYVEVKVASWLLSSPSFPNIDLDDAFIIQPEQLGENFISKEEGITLSGVRYRYIVIAHNPGRLKIPSLDITFSYSGEKRQAVETTLKTEPLTLTTEHPDTANASEPITVATDLEVEQHFTPSIANLKVGDAFTRSVTVTADNAMGFVLPAVFFEPVTGAEIYPANPRIEDNLKRGNKQGKRTDSASYILQSEGVIELPSISLRWFDLESQSIKESVVPSVNIVVASNPDMINSALVDSSKSFGTGLVSNIANIGKRLAPYKYTMLIVSVFSILLYVLYRRFGAQIKYAVRKSVGQVSSSRRIATLRLALSCLVLPTPRLRNALYHWSIDNKSHPAHEQWYSWQSVHEVYSPDRGPRIARVPLMKDLIKYAVQHKATTSRAALDQLNP